MIAAARTLGASSLLVASVFYALGWVGRSHVAARERREAAENARMREAARKVER